MKILIPLFLLATLITAGACNNSDKEANETTAPAVPVNAATSDTLHTTPGVNTNSVAAPATLQQGAVALNPPHGQPGHRCDIEVGQPLNSAASSSAQPVMTTPAVQPQMAPQSPTANPPLPNSITPGNGQAKINPPHGQPGHRCDVAVGAAL